METHEYHSRDPGASPKSPNDSPLVMPFAGITAHHLALVGGKGANLGELTRAGFPIPNGFCITTAAFHQFLGMRELKEGASIGSLYDTLDTLKPQDVDAARKVGAEVRSHLLQLPIPPEVEDATVKAWQALGPESSYAVRSSATAEDLPHASFAGQHDTYLNVRGRADVLEAVRKCWASLFTDRAILYRMEHHFDHRRVGLAVVVQRMVRPEIAGIMFTADPLTGHRHVVSIDASWGLGEALVSGLVSSDLYRVDKRTGQLIELRVADKQMAIRARPDGGTVRESLSEARRHAQVLTEERARAVAEVGTRVEAHYGKPQDIEWCIDGSGELFVVQARPVTTLFPLPEPAPADSALHVYMSFSHVQVMTAPMPHFARSLLRHLFPFGKASQPDIETPYLTSAGGRLYIDLTPVLYLRVMRRLIPNVLTIADPLIAQAVGKIAAREAFREGRHKAAYRPHLHEVLHWVGPILVKAQPWLWWRRPETAVEIVSQFCDALVEDVRHKLNAAAPGADRIQVARECVGSVFPRLFLAIPPKLAAGLLARKLLIALTQAKPEDINELLRGLSGNVGTEIDFVVGELADLARHHPAVAQYLTRVEPAAALASLDKVKDGRVFQDAFQAFLARYGMRGPSEIDISRPRWREDPTPLLQVIISNLQQSTNVAPRDRQSQLQARGEAAADRLVAAARRGLLGGLRAHLVRRLTRVARNLLAIREHPKFMLVRILDMVKVTMVEAANLLVANGRIDQLDDIWHLSFNEVLELFQDRDVDLRARVAERREEHERYARFDPPRVMTSDGEIPEVEYDRADIPEGALVGNSASAGVIEGLAKVIMDPTTDSLGPGEILVAPFTDPGWTPLFINAAGLVTEVGGLMTHGSVVAREYGIPAVVGVVAATKHIRSGQRVRVNGNRGFVQILDQTGRDKAEHKRT